MEKLNGKFKSVLFISCPDIIFGLERIMLLPNLGLENIAGNIMDIANVKILDLKLVKKSKNKIKQSINEIEPDIVGISCMTFQYPTALEIAEYIKEIDSNIKIALGGYHPTLEYKEVIKENAVDFVIRGEGEFTFRELVLGKELDRIDGLSYKIEQNVKNNPARELIHENDLNNLFPYRDCRIVKRKYMSIKGGIALIETSRGCLASCKFCSVAKFYGRHFRKFSIEHVIREIEKVAKDGIKKIFFVDDNITLDMDRLKNLCENIIEYKLNHLKYFVQASSKEIANRPDVVKKMAEAGFEFVFLGIENVSDNNLKQLGKGDIRDANECAIKTLRDNGIFVIGGFIVGNQDDDAESISDNVKYAVRTQIDFPIFFILTPFPGTVVREALIKKGLVTNSSDYSLYTASFANIKTNDLTADELHKETAKAYKKIYLSFSTIKRFFRNLDKKYWWLVLKWIGIFLNLYIRRWIFGYQRTKEYMVKSQKRF